MTKLTICTRAFVASDLGKVSHHTYVRGCENLAGLKNLLATYINTGMLVLRCTNSVHVLVVRISSPMVVCVCVIIPFILDVRLVDAPAGVTQEEGHIGFLHLTSVALTLIFIVRRIHGAGESSKPFSYKNNNKNKGIQVPVTVLRTDLPLVL